MKKILLLLLLSLAFTLTVNAQEDKTVTLVVSGQGITQDEAKQRALRSAIEQAFGTFISSKTELLNDNLIKDEIVSVANGNIQKFEVLSEVKKPDGGYATTLKAIVSVSKLISFCESKGLEVEFKGATFAMNIKLQKLNEEAEYKAILNLCEVSQEILSKSIDYSLEVSEPYAHKDSSDLFWIRFNVTCRPNENLKIFEEYFWATISKLSMPSLEIDNYKKINKSQYLVAYSKLFFPDYGGGCNDCFSIYDMNRLINKDSVHISFFLRNKNSHEAIKKLMQESNKNLYNFRVTSEIDTIIITKENIDYPQENVLSKEPRYADKWSVYSNKSHGFPECLFGYTYSNGNAFLHNNDSFKIFENSGSTNALDIYIKKTSNTNPINFPYYHILPLVKLEKISKYRIEPWENNKNN